MEVADIAIVGGGPAGVAAGVYAARKKLKTVLIAEEFGGQSIVSDGIENWIGILKISGYDLAKSLENHIRSYEGKGVTLHQQQAVKVTETKDTFQIELKDGSVITTRGIVLATGSKRRNLTIPGANTFEHKGLTYCASCDGPLFSGNDVAVIGGGNAGFETAAQLLAYAKSVTLIHIHSTFKKADKITVEKVLAHPNMTAITDAETKEILGETLLTGLIYTDKKNRKDVKLDVQGVFVEIGLIPKTTILEGIVTMDTKKRIIVDPKTQQTSHKRIWAAGDCSDGNFHQNNVAAGDAVKALEHAYIKLQTS